MSRRFIVIVLDGFGIGAMDDAYVVRPQDTNANTAKHLLELNENISWNTLFDLGLINALKENVNNYKKNPKAVFGCSNLAHFGADTFFGHQEILGTKPKKPVINYIKDYIDIIEADLQYNGYNTRRYSKDNHELLCVNQAIFIGDNLETDAGQAINVTGTLDLTSFDEIKKVGKIIRKHFKVSRIIAFGGRNVSFDDLLNAIDVRNGCIGVDAPKSGVYNNHYQVVHIGYGVDESLQLPNVLHQVQIKSYLYGKVADIVENPYGKLTPGVDTKTVFNFLLEDLKSQKEGFFILNVQETDLAGHSQDPQKYINILNISSVKIKEVLNTLEKEDLLIIMADHGNDPTANSSKHSREMVPILIYKDGIENIDIGTRDTLADVGATAAEYFGTKLEYGNSFLNLLQSKK